MAVCACIQRGSESTHGQLLGVWFKCADVYFLLRGALMYGKAGVSQGVSDSRTTILCEGVTEGLQRNLIKGSAQFLNFLVPVALTFSCRFLQERKP